MSALFSFKQIIKALANTFMPLVCVIVIMLMTASCSTMTTKQATSTNTTASSLTAKEKSDNETTANIQQATECRYIPVTGSRFGKKICRTKEAWAEIAKKHERAADELVRGLTDQSSLPPTTSGMGQINSAASPGY